jgi:hypothetical protein
VFIFPLDSFVMETLKCNYVSVILRERGEVGNWWDVFRLICFLNGGFEKI